jgi:hypothetical protein
MNSLIITCINNIPILGKHASIQTSSQNCLLAYLFTDHCLLACVSTNTQAACVMLPIEHPDRQGIDQTSQKRRRIDLTAWSQQ